MKGFFYGQSTYSLLNSTVFLNDLVNKSKEYGYSFVALTDEALFACHKFIDLCENAQIKPLIGLRLVVENEVILLYALNNNGYINLMNISTLSKSSELKFIDLKSYNKDIILVTPGEEGAFEYLFSSGNITEANNIIKKYKSIFPNTYIGLQKQKYPFEIMYDFIKEYAIKSNIKYLPIHKVSFLNKDDIDAFEVIKKIKGEEINISFYTEEYLKDINLLDEEFLDDDVYKYIDEIYNNIDIHNIKITKPLITYPNKANISSKEYLKELCYLGLKKRLNNVITKNYVDRLEHELEIISKMGYDDYFLLVFDFVRYAKKNNIFIGPGRGSAAGSLVSYLIGITNVDPLKYDLLFERFLNPNRVTMPDIDIDIQNDKRMEVIDYLINKYGIDHVCMITTFDTFKGKSAINDVSKAFKIEEYRMNEITNKCLVSDSDNRLSVTKESIYNAYLNETDYTIKKIFKIAYKIFDIPKTTSTHAAGVILSSDSLYNTIPLMNSNGYMQSQFEAHDLEEMGLLKMDLLALKNLTMIGKINSLANIDLNNINLDDKLTYELLSSGNTNGIFQLEGRGIRRVLKKFKPKTFDDLVVILALYRPGPMDQIEEFIDRRNGKKFDYPNIKLKPILEKTYGIIVYQEQIMRIASDYANLSMAEADTLRRAISKKNSELIDEYREKFIKNVKDKKEANMIYDYIVKFADYGFNKSHSVSYAIISYTLAYLKAHYLKYFIVSFLNDAVSDVKGSLEYFQELKQNNINVITPDINYSSNIYEVIDNNIYMPLSLVKSLNKDKISMIVEERKKGYYLDFNDFYDRVKLDNDSYKALIYSSAFYGIKKEMIQKIDRQNDFIYDELIKGNEYDFDYLKEQEELSLGFNYNYSILNKYSNLKEKYNCIYIDEATEYSTFNTLVYIKAIKEILTKKKENMSFITLSDGRSNFEATLFPSNYNKVMEKLNKNTKISYNKDVLILKIKSSMRNNEMSYEILDAFKC